MPSRRDHAKKSGARRHGARRLAKGAGPANCSILRPDRLDGRCLAFAFSTLPLAPPRARVECGSRGLFLASSRFASHTRSPPFGLLQGCLGLGRGRPVTLPAASDDRTDLPGQCRSLPARTIKPPESKPETTLLNRQRFRNHDRSGRSTDVSVHRLTEPCLSGSPQGYAVALRSSSHLPNPGLDLPAPSLSPPQCRNPTPAALPGNGEGCPANQAELDPWTDAWRMDWQLAQPSFRDFP